MTTERKNQDNESLPGLENDVPTKPWSSQDYHRQNPLEIQMRIWETV